jgi:hypothetical protein
VDGRRIYHVAGLGMRVVPGDQPRPEAGTELLGYEHGTHFGEDAWLPIEQLSVEWRGRLHQARASPRYPALCL